VRPKQLVETIKKASKNRVSTIVLIVASLMMVLAIWCLIPVNKVEKSKTSHPQAAIDRQLLSEYLKEANDSKEQTIPMQESMLDFDESLDFIGQVIIDKVGLDLPIVKGRGKEDGTGFDKAVYACTNKTTQKLGVNNYVLSAHSTYLSATEYFSPLLVNEDGSFDMKQPIVLEKLKLKIGDEIKVNQSAEQMEYRFKITKLFIDDGQGNFNTTYQAMADKVGQAQLTLYTCTDIDGENRLVIQADILDKRSLSS
jgi:sortase (surface protein transpeptidase)